MKKSTILLCFIVWSVSLIAAYYTGSHGSEALTTPTVKSRPATTAAPLNLPTEDIASEVEPSKLEAFFDGESLSLEEMLREIPTLSAKESRQLLGQALALPKSDPKRARLINELLG